VLLQASNGTSTVSLPLSLFILSTYYIKTTLHIACQTLSSDRDMMQVDICCVVLVMYSGVLCGAEVMYSGVLCSVGHVQWCVVAYRSCTVVCCVV